MDASSRITTAAYKRPWEDHFNTWITPMQRGFLREQSMLANVVMLEHAVMLTAARSERRMFLFLGFRAAFPSASHAYM